MRKLPSAAAPVAASHYRRWQVLAPLGLVAVGLGASAVGQAAIRKARGQAWFVPGTLALIGLNAGLCLFGEAVKHRVLYEVREAA